MSDTESLTSAPTPTAERPIVSETPPPPPADDTPGDTSSSNVTPVIQAKLTVGASADPLEREADAFADRVVQGMEVPGPTPVHHGLPPLQRQPDDEVEGEVLQTKGGIEGEAPAGVRDGIQQSRGAGVPLSPAIQGAMETSFGVDFSAVRIHTDSNASEMSRQLKARAFTHGSDIYFNAGEYHPDVPSGKHLLAHELTHVLQQNASALRTPSSGDTTLPVARAPEGVLQRTPEEDEAWIRNPPSARMQASLDGLEFFPTETAMFALTELQLGSTAIVFARLAGPAYDPAWVHQWVDSHPSTWELHARSLSAVARVRMRPRGCADVLAFLTTLLGDRILITPEQRTRVVAGEALNPVPPEILAMLGSFVSASTDPTAGGPNILAEQQAVLNQLAAMWWGRTQAYVQAFLAWKAEPNEETLSNAASALDDLFLEFQPYSALLRLIHDDADLQPLPEWGMLWPPRRDGRPREAGEVAPSEAVAFTRYASSQARSLITLARRDAAARRSLLEGYGAFRSRADTRSEGDQPVTTSPSPYNAPPLPVTLASYPRIDPPLYAAATGVNTTFFANIRFENVIEGLQWAFGGWQYQWEALRVPDDDLASLGIMSIPPEPPPGWSAVQEDLSRDLRYARTDLQRIGSIARLTSLFGPPGANAETLVAANFVMDAAGTLISSGIRELTRPSSEFDVRFREAGLHLIRLRVGPTLAQEAQVAQFRRAPSVAWMPVYARPLRALGEERLRLELAGRDQAVDRYWELMQLLSTPASIENREELEREFEELQLGLYGSTLELLQDQRRRLDAQRARIESGTATPEDRAISLTSLRERITQLDQLIAMRQDRSARLGAGALRLPATLVKDSDGTVISLTIEAAQVSANPQRWYVSDLTSPRSGQTRRSDGIAGDGTLAPDYPAEDSILAALKEVLESPSGYGRGYLSVWFSAPLSGPDRPIGGVMRGIRIETDEAGIVMHGVESLSTLISIGAVVAAPFTGGSSLVLLMPVGIVGAVPSAYRLVHRGQMGTLRFDLETAMQVVDVVSAALQLGEIGAGMRAAATVGTRTGLRWAVVEGSLWISGIGANGLGMLLMGAGLVDQLRSLEGLPPGLRAARMTEIIGNAMLTIGIQVGAHLASRSHLESIHEGVGTAAAGADLPGTAVRPVAPVEARAPAAGRPRGRSEPPAHLSRAMPTEVLRTTPLDIDSSLRGNTVRVEYHIGRNGRVDPGSIRMVASPHATAADIALHVETARTLHAYAGLLGAVHEGIESLRGITGSRRAPEQGSAAWEAQLEFAKLNDIIRARLRRLSSLSVDEARAADIASDLENLRAQLTDAQRILAGYDPANPRGFIAAESVAQRRSRIAGENRETVARLNIATVTIAADGRITVREPSRSSRGNPTPGYHFRGSGTTPPDIALSRNPTAGSEPLLQLIQHGDRLYIIPQPRTGATVTGADHLNNIRAQLDSYPPPLPGHVYRPDRDGWQLRHDGVSPNPPQRIVTERGLPVRDEHGEYQYRTPTERPTFADRQRTAVSTQPPPERRNSILEAELTRQGVALGDEQRAILRRWSDTLTELGRISAESLGRNLPSEAEIARAAVAELTTRLPPDGSYIEARYDAFRSALREACLAAMFGVTAETLRGALARGEALPVTRTPAEQRALYDRLYATLPDNQSRGELWTRYRETRGGLSVAQGGFEPFRHLPLTAGQVLQHTPVTMMDGAIRVPADLGPNLPPHGDYALESKAGTSYDPEQAGRYSDHLTNHNGQVVMSDGLTTYAGVVYLFDNPSSAARAARDLQGRHPNIFIAYVDANGAVQWVSRSSGGGP